MTKTIAKGAASIAWATVWYFRWFILIVILALAAGIWLGHELIPEPESLPKDVIKIETLETEVHELGKELSVKSDHLQQWKSSYESEAAMRDSLEATFTHRAVDQYQVVEYELTAYCHCEICCGTWSDGYTASGTLATQGRTIAVDPAKIPIGSTVYIEGLGVFIAEDTGSAINGNIIDIYFNDHEDALEFGRQTRNIIVLQLGGSND